MYFFFVSVIFPLFVVFFAFFLNIGRLVTGGTSSITCQDKRNKGGMCREGKEEDEEMVVLYGGQVSQLFTNGSHTALTYV